MPKLTPVKIDSHTVIYIEASDEVTPAEVPQASETSEKAPVTRGGTVEKGMQQFKS